MLMMPPGMASGPQPNHPDTLTGCGVGERRKGRRGTYRPSLFRVEDSQKQRQLRQRVRIARSTCDYLAPYLRCTAGNCNHTYLYDKLIFFHFEDTMDHFEALLQRAACAVNAAAAACRDWEAGGDSDPVSDTAWEADEAITEALDAVAGIDPTLALDTYPETRLGRLVLAARLLVLAGIDEGGRSEDLEIAARLLEIATEA